MKYIFKNMVPVMLLAVLMSGCGKELPGSNDIAFVPEMAEMTKTSAPGLFNGTDLTPAGQFKVTGYDGTKQAFADRAVSKSGSTWKFTENPVLWTENHTMTFWADANMPSWASLTSSASTSATLAITQIPAAAADQWDPLVGYYSGTGNSGIAPVKFYHPFVAVTFKTGTCGDPQVISGITNVSVSGVYKSASATVTSGSSGLNFNWTPSGTTTVNGPFTGTQSTKPFILLPQNLASAKVTLNVTVTLVAGGTATKTIEISTGAWQSGIHYYYTLDYVYDIPMMETLKVTLTDWVYIQSTSGKNFFDANFDNSAE